MRIAAIYDVHGNLPALEAVIEQVFAENVDRVVVGGDVVAGPMTGETIAYLKDVSPKVPVDFIHGNHESEMLCHINGEPINSLSSRAEEEAKWAATQLNAASFADHILQAPSTTDAYKMLAQLEASQTV